MLRLRNATLGIALDYRLCLSWVGASPPSEKCGKNQALRLALLAQDDSQR
jgi:hypothetical protein